MNAEYLPKSLALSECSENVGDCHYPIISVPLSRVILMALQQIPISYIGILEAQREEMTHLRSVTKREGKGVIRGS